MTASEHRQLFLVDDDEVVRNTLSHGLSDYGFHVTTFSDGQSALEAWNRNCPDVAIVDIGLPDISGTELVSRMLELAHRPIIILSRHHDSDVVAGAIERGVTGYLVKPISAVQLIPPLETALARSNEVDVLVRERLNAEGDSRAQLDAVLEQLGFGVAIVNEHRKVIRRNHAVDRILEHGDVVAMSQGELMAVEEPDVAPFKEFLDEILRVPSEDDGGGQVIAMGRNSPGRHVQVWGAPLGSADSAQGARVALVLMSDPDEHTPVPGSVLKSLYGLTATESRLAEALVNGLSVEQFATKSKTSYNTARSHLKSIFVKTRTNRQVDLVRLLTRLLGNLGK